MNLFPIQKKYTKHIFIALMVMALIAVSALWLYQPPMNTNQPLQPAKQEEPEALEVNFDLNLVYSYPDSARVYYRHILNQMQQLGVSNNKIKVLNFIGLTYAFQARYDRAMDEFYRALELAIERQHTSQKAQLYNNIGAVYLSTKRYRSALDFLLKSSELYEAMGDTINIPTIRTNIGKIYFEINTPEKAYSYYHDAYKLFSAQNNVIGISSVAKNLAQYHQLKNHTDSAFYYFDKAIKLGKEINDYRGLYEYYYAKGHFYKEKALYPEALKKFEESDSIARILNSPLKIARPILASSMVHLRKGNIEMAHALIRNAMEYNEEIQDEELKFKINRAQYKVYKKEGRLAEAFHHYQAADRHESNLYDQTDFLKVYDVEIEKLSREMEAKQMNMEKQALVLSKRKNTMVMIIVVSVSIIFTISLLYYFFINRIKQSQIEKQNQDKIRHSREKNRAALEAELQERKRLGMELHDGVGPMISLTKLNITNIIEDQKLSETRKKQLLKKVTNDLDATLNEMKNISCNLAPMVLIEKGFEYALKNLVSKVNQAKKHQIHVNINGLDDSIESCFEHALFRAIQEILNNIIQHAEANEIIVEVLQNDDEITVMIEDNGKGFEMANQREGLGLTSTASRVEGLGGVFLVDSKTGRGTIITIILPVSTSAINKRTIFSE